MINFSRWTIWASIAVCIIAAIVAFPNVLPQSTRDALPSWFPNQTLNLGLDLQGGSYLLLSADLDSVFKEKIQATRDDIQQSMRDAKIHSQALLQGDDTVVVKIQDADNVDAANEKLKTVIQSVEPSLLGGGAKNYDLSRGADGSFIFKMTDGAKTYYRTQTIAQSIEIVRRRVDELGTKEPIIQQQGTDRILIQVPGLSDASVGIRFRLFGAPIELDLPGGSSRLKQIIGQTAKLQFRFVNEAATDALKNDPNGRVPVDSELLLDKQGNRFAIEKRVIVTGEQLTNAQQSTDPRDGAPVVAFTFDSQGARRFGDATKANVGRHFAIVLDSVVVTAPSIDEPILGGSGQIRGSFTYESANDLAILLRAGALPTKLTVEEERTVGAELGADSIQAGTLAAVGGIALVVVLLIASYGLFGAFAVVGLTMNLVVTLAIMTLLGATMTLPGIAGLILSIGMTVDANVLFYERMRDERDAGKPPVSTLSAGFAGAMSAIIDANITQLLAVLILFQLGAGPVRGFAVTLGIGIAVSMFTAVLLTRIMIVSWYRWRRPKVLPL